MYTHGKAKRFAALGLVLLSIVGLAAGTPLSVRPVSVPPAQDVNAVRDCFLTLADALAMQLQAGSEWQGHFDGLPLMRPEAGHNTLQLGPDGLLYPTVARQVLHYSVEASAPGSYKAEDRLFWQEGGFADAAFAGRVATPVTVEVAGRRLALCCAANGAFQVTLAVPDPADIRQQWVTYRGHLYSVYALEAGAQAGFKTGLGRLMGELYIGADGVRLAAAGTLGSAAALRYTDGHLLGRSGYALAVAADGTLYAAAAVRYAAVVTLHSLTMGQYLTNIALSTPVPSAFLANGRSRPGSRTLPAASQPAATVVWWALSGGGCGAAAAALLRLRRAKRHR